VHAHSVKGVRVAAAQFATGLDADANRGRCVEAVRRAADEGAGLVVLPEAAMCGFGSPTTDLSELAEPLDGPFVSALVGAASNRITVVAGMFERVPGERRVFNTLVLVGPSGLLGAYRKVHLYDALGWVESERIAPGVAGSDNTPLAPVGDLSVGVLTCYDLRFPESARAALDAGATVLAVPAAWVAGEHKVEHWRTLLRARAIENTAYVVAAAQPGPTYTGHSQVVDPFGVVLSELGPTESGVATAEVTRARLEEARSALPVLAHRRFTVAPALEVVPEAR
jgi:deaminated glutathione amidase